ERGECGIIEPAPREIAHLVVFDQHISLVRESPRQCCARIVREIDRDRAFVAIRAAEVGGISGRFTLLIRQPWWTPRASVVADARALDLDDVSAEIGQRLRAGRAGEHAREVDYAQTGEGGTSSLWRSILRHGVRSNSA